MSIWTHCNGNIVYEEINFNENFVGLRLDREYHWDDPSTSPDTCEIPQGSEGSLYQTISSSQTSASQKRWNITITGDLRDHSFLHNYGDIQGWLSEAMKQTFKRSDSIFVLREAVVSIRYEDDPDWTYIFRVCGDDWTESRILNK